MKHFIYTLTDPRTRVIRYVGKTNKPAIRFAMHLCERRGTHKNNWLNNLKSLGLRPIMDVIEECTCETWAERERFWIAHFRQLGYPLTNLDSGGCSGKLLSEETKAKISASNKGKKMSQEAVEKMKASKRANLTPEVRERMRQAQLGKKRTPEQRAAHSLALKGRVVSEETKRKIGLANSQKRASEETKAKIREARAKQVNVRTDHLAKYRTGPTPQCIAASIAASKTRVISEETRAKMKAAALGRKASPEALENIRKANQANWDKRKLKLQRN